MNIHSAEFLKAFKQIDLLIRSALNYALYREPVNGCGGVHGGGLRRPGAQPHSYEEAIAPSGVTFWSVFSYVQGKEVVKVREKTDFADGDLCGSNCIDLSSLARKHFICIKCTVGTVLVLLHICK